ncbi:Serine/arginine-rich splicing factor RS40 [Cucurbita argyrosperma subsp. argyrosperma]|nr:Serine/arginine-rich splicing factor RS40 [Cucurbita argyrosperma subsp. argyrosperma]
MKPIFCGNFEYDARQPDLERLFSRYGKVDRVDMKSGFAFIYMEDERDAEDAIRALDRREFGRKGRRLRVEWTKQERGIRRPGGGGGGGGGGSRRSSTNTRPSKTLFVINFDPYHTRTRDLERHFDPYGKILSVRIRRNFAFVQYELQEDATRALEVTNMSKLMDRVISVEYAVRDDDEKRNGFSPDRNRDRSPDRKRRSPSPYRRERGSPDYGNGITRSPYRRQRASPDYGSRRSPSPYQRERERERGSPDYGRGRSPNQSPYRRERERSSDHGRGRSPNQSPYRRERERSSDHGRGRSPNQSPYRRERERSSDHARAPSHSPPHQRERPNDDRVRNRSRSPYGRERGSPTTDGRGTSYSPRDRERSNHACVRVLLGVAAVHHKQRNDDDDDDVVESEGMWISICCFRVCLVVCNQYE